MPGKPRNFTRLANGALATIVVDDRGKQRTLIFPRAAEAEFSLDYLAAVCTEQPLPRRNWNGDSYTEGEV